MRFIDISEFELTIDNNLAGDRYKLGQLARKGLGRGGHRTVTGKISKEYDSLSERNLFRNLTQGCKFRFKWTQADGRSFDDRCQLDRMDGQRSESRL
jgi:hypothetical protein